MNILLYPEFSDEQTNEDRDITLINVSMFKRIMLAWGRGRWAVSLKHIGFCIT